MCRHLDYRIYTSSRHLDRADVVEFYPGEFSGLFWNAGSIFMPEDGFVALARLFYAVAPRFEWWGQNRLAGEQLVTLGRLLDLFRRGVLQAATAADLRHLCRDSQIDDASFQAVRSRLVRAVEEIDHVRWLAAGRRHGLWVMGP